VIDKLSLDGFGYS